MDWTAWYGPRGAEAGSFVQKASCPIYPIVRISRNAINAFTSSGGHRRSSLSHCLSRYRGSFTRCLQTHHTLLHPAHPLSVLLSIQHAGPCNRVYPASSANT